MIDVWANAESSDLASLDNIYLQPPVIELNQKEQKKLRQRQRVLKKYTVNLQQRHVVVFRVNATQDQIWETITSYQSYPDWVKGVEYTNVYQQNENNYYVEFHLAHWLLGEFQYSVQHYLSADSWMKWQLDESKQSDFSFSVGFWQVVAAQDEPGMHDVFYSADLKFKKPKSQFTRKKVIRAGLKYTSIWVTREAEKKAAR